MASKSSLRLELQAEAFDAAGAAAAEGAEGGAGTPDAVESDASADVEARAAWLSSVTGRAWHSPPDPAKHTGSG